MNIFQALLLGVIQGTTEFLPISSSGHLILIPWLFKWPIQSLCFDIMLHGGTLCALLAYFRKDWIRIIGKGLAPFKYRESTGSGERKLFWLIIIASIPAAVIAKLLTSYAETVFRNPASISLTMGGFAIVFFIIDRQSKKNKDLDGITVQNAILIGILQGFAVIPGISRSAITIAAGLAVNLKRQAAIKFSFLLSAPIIFGAILTKTGELLNMANSSDGLPLLIGFISSCLVGILAIHYLFKYTQRHNFNLFIAYRVMLSILIISLLLLRRP